MKSIGTRQSYRELPILWTELGTVYRYERSGVLRGLMQVRGLTQNDAYILCLPEQIADEILGGLNLTELILSEFGFEDYEVNLSTRPTKSVGADDILGKATFLSVWRARQAVKKAGCSA